MLDTKERLMTAIDELDKALGDKKLTKANLDSIDASGNQSLMMAVNIARRYLMDGETSVKAIRDDINDQLKGAIDYYTSQYKYHYNPDFNPRSIVGDNYDNINERYYGNNHVKGPDAFHGTHVAGIIAAQRDNNLGMKGVADNVKIMIVRVVPDGDERDKDVANGIRYAVDNGANIINMSFGKSYAWNKDAVDKAVKYAEKHDVLLVHAAGKVDDQGYKRLCKRINARMRYDRIRNRDIYIPLPAGDALSSERKASYSTLEKDLKDARFVYFDTSGNQAPVFRVEEDMLETT